MSRLAVAAASALALAACSGHAAAPSAPLRAASAAPRRHVHVARALHTPARRAVFDAFASKNPGAWKWTGPDQVDPFRGHLLHAERTDVRSEAGRAASREAALASGLAFVTRNADVLGIAASEIPRLDLDAPEGHDEDFDGVVAVHVAGDIPMRGYASFPQLRARIEMLLAVDAHGDVVRFSNVSRIHPRLDLDLTPALAAEDPRALAKVVGRRVFAVAVADAATAADLDPREMRDLPRIDLGPVRAEDVRRVHPDIHVSDGPLGAYRTYRLVHRVEIVKTGGTPRTAFFFVYAVDADTGEVVEDAKVPIVEGAP